MIYKSIKSLVKLLKEEEEVEAKRKPKIIKLADPTIFTITSPSCWQKNKLSSPDIALAEVFDPIQPEKIIVVPLPNPTPSPPQKPLPDISDYINFPDERTHDVSKSICPNPDIQVIF